MSRSVWSVYILTCAIIACFVCSSAREITSKRAQIVSKEARGIRFNKYPEQQHWVEDGNNHGVHTYTHSRNRRTIRKSFGVLRQRLRQMFNAIFRRGKKNQSGGSGYAPPTYEVHQYEPSPTYSVVEEPVGYETPQYESSQAATADNASALKEVPRNKPIEVAAQNEDGLEGLRVIPAPDLTAIPDPEEELPLKDVNDDAELVEINTADVLTGVLTSGDPSAQLLSSPNNNATQDDLEDASDDVVNIDSVDDGLLSEGGVIATTDIPVNDTSDLTIDLTDGFVDLSNGVLSETAGNQSTSDQINETNITDNLDNNDADDDDDDVIVDSEDYDALVEDFLQEAKTILGNDTSDLPVDFTDESIDLSNEDLLNTSSNQSIPNPLDDIDIADNEATTKLPEENDYDYTVENVSNQTIAEPTPKDVNAASDETATDQINETETAEDDVNYDIEFLETDTADLSGDVSAQLLSPPDELPGYSSYNSPSPKSLPGKTFNVIIEQTIWICVEV